MPPLLVAALVVLLEGLSLSTLFPVIHAHCQSLGGGAGWVGAIFALVAAPKVFLNPVWGRFSDRVGRRPVLLLTTGGALLGSVGWAIAPGLVWLAGARLVTGVFGAQAVVASAIAADASSRERRAASMAALGIAFGVAFTLGPLLGGVAGDRLGYASVGWLCAGFQAISLLLIFFALKETLPAGAEKSRAAQHVDRRRLRSRPRVVGLLAITILLTIGSAAMIASFGLYTQKLYGFTSVHTALAFSLFGLFGAMAQGGIRPLVARFGERGVALAGVLLAIVGFGMFAARPPQPLFWLAVSFNALGAGMLTPCLTAMLSHCVGGSEQGALLGLNQSAIGVGRVVGFSAGGALFGALGASAPFISAAACAAIAFAWMLMLPAEPDRVEAPEPQVQAARER